MPSFRARARLRPYLGDGNRAWVVRAVDGVGSSTTAAGRTVRGGSGVNDGNIGYVESIEAFDKLGNKSRSLETFTVTVESDAPLAFELIAPEDGVAVAEARPTSGWQDSGDPGSGSARYEVSVDNGAGGICASPCTPRPCL
ncbi:MAG: hypothetical protein HY699_16490 [Deltaproteobacteria bacterium]|nr:hypothetical protein [Deltaproteobacteria bacterium]